MESKYARNGIPAFEDIVANSPVRRSIYWAASAVEIVTGLSCLILLTLSDEWHVVRARVSPLTAKLKGDKYQSTRNESIYQNKSIGQHRAIIVLVGAPWNATRLTRSRLIAISVRLCSEI